MRVHDEHVVARAWAELEHDVARGVYNLLEELTIYRDRKLPFGRRSERATGEFNDLLARAREYFPASLRIKELRSLEPGALLPAVVTQLSVLI